jgi:hypothetical protein
MRPAGLSHRCGSCLCRSRRCGGDAEFWNIVFTVNSQLLFNWKPRLANSRTYPVESSATIRLQQGKPPELLVAATHLDGRGPMRTIGVPKVFSRGTTPLAATLSPGDQIAERLTLKNPNDGDFIFVLSVKAK